uniref:26S proteasome non-ATPase regulatory subunit 2 n=1 Tax=Hirondellea gigas TaxID=1518452 RepID=A0A2P2I8Z8_9CRUS
MVSDTATSSKEKDEVFGISEEDAKLKQTLELLVERAQDADLGIRVQALEALRKEISSSTTSMTSVPKPLKYLHPHYQALKDFYGGSVISDDKKSLADILSCLAMTMSKKDSRESLRFRMESGAGDVGRWGHEYVRHLTAEIGSEFDVRSRAAESTAYLDALVQEIIIFNMSHNAVADACDLLMEVDKLERLPILVTLESCDRVCMYLLKCSCYVADTDELDKILGIAFDIYVRCERLCDALRVAIKIDDKNLIDTCFRISMDGAVTKQLAYILGAHKLALPMLEEDEELMEIVGNCKLNEHFLNLAQELNIQEAKKPEDVYKSHLAESQGRGKRGATGGVDSAKENLAATFVNAFVHAGFGKDLLMTPEESNWLYKNKDHGMLSATASLGMILLWDLETGFSAIDKFSFSNENYVKAGALFATGMLSCGVTSEMDAAMPLLCDYIENESDQLKLCAVIGLGLAYAGTSRPDVLELLQPVVMDSDLSIELSSFAALSLGLVFVGSCNDEVCGSIIQALMDRTDTDLNDSSARFLSLGLAMLYLGRGEAAEAVIEAVGIIEHPICESVKLIIQTFSYAGTGNVLQVQGLLATAGTHPPPPEKKLKTDENKDESKEDREKKEKERNEEVEKARLRDQHDLQPIAVVGISLIAMGEDIGAEMAYRAFDNLLQYGEVSVRRAVPLALGLLSISDPNLSVMETLSKLSHDADEQVSQNAILGLGLIGSGTNNSRIAKMLRHLAVYYQKEPNHLFLTRISQGLIHLGKGLVTLNPFHSDNMLLSKTAVCGLLTVIYAAMSMKTTILSTRHFILYYIVCAIRPRMLITVDENLNPLPVSVRVGQAVDTVRLAGKPKRITGFQTHTTPVLLSRSERAELASDQYVAISPVLEGFVILKKNPDVSLDED